MIPKDKFGNPIFPHIYKKLIENAVILKRNGFRESKTKPNLFYKINKSQVLIFFADMRGTDIIPIWNDTRPLFFIKLLKKCPKWKKNRVSNNFMKFLSSEGCECRLSFEDHSDEDEDGYCKLCGKDFRDKGYYCSKECEKGISETYQGHCAICGKDLNFNNFINHHLNYEEKKTIRVCRSCHAKIHKSGNFTFLKPDEKESKNYYKPKYLKSKPD